MEENKKTGFKGWWEKHGKKVKYVATAAAAFTVGVLLAKPNKEDQMLLKQVHTWDPCAETKRSFGQNFMLIQSDSKHCEIFGCYPDGEDTLSGVLDDTKNYYSEKGMDPDTTKATGMIIFTK